MYLEGHVITSGYRPSTRPDHEGVDFDAKIGTPVPDLSSGEVVFAGYIPALYPGYSAELICMVQSQGYFILYGHLSRVLVNQGDRVESGDILGYSGNSGYTTGPHLHIEKRLGTKSASQPLSAYTSQDIRPMLDAYGQGATGGAHEMTEKEHQIKSLTDFYLSTGSPKAVAIETATRHANAGTPALTVMTNDIKTIKAQGVKDADGDKWRSFKKLLG